MIRYAQRLYWVDTLLWLGIVGLPIVPGLLIQQFFNGLTEQTSARESPWVWIGLLLAIGIARIVTIFLGRITKTQHRFLMSGLVRHNLLLGLLNRPGAELAESQKTSPGELLSYFRDDATHIENTVVFTNEIFAETVFALVSVGLLLSVNARMTLLVFLPLCAISFLVHRAEHRLKRYRRNSRQATQQVTGLIGELFTAVQAVKVAGAEASMLNELQQRCDRRRQFKVREQVFNALLNAGFGTIISLGTGLILLMAAQNLGDSLTVGDFALFVYYLAFVTYFFAFLGGFFAIVQQSEVSFERMDELVNHPITQPSPLYLKPILGPQSPLPVPPPPLTVQPLHTLQLKGLTYHYPEGNSQRDTGITNISFTLTRGSLTVITGPVGAGKTTLLRVLLCLLPRQSGKIIWNGQEIHDPANFLVPPHVAYTPQIPQLFSTSLRENLLLGQTGPSLKTRLNQALSVAAFAPDLAKMPQGLDTPIGTRGVRLSGGQKQRLAAARMILRRSELLIFDDLSSALDVETEQQLWDGLLEKKAVAEPFSYSGVPPLPYEPTYLTVSHRPVILQRADQIVLLESGQVSFVGSPHNFFA
ncbi:ABC transporter ATP-binding protein [Leptothoe sp. LEGE 181152]|nr:ABC transporter ATP-binding protein [Leptothoe sp. LEGE 181152]